jgi:hypothetical protein
MYYRVREMTLDEISNKSCDRGFEDDQFEFLGGSLGPKEKRVVTAILHASLPTFGRYKV